MPQLPLIDEDMADKKSLGQIVSEWEQQYGMERAGQPAPKPAFPKRTGNFIADTKSALDYSSQHGLNLSPHNDAAIAQAEQKNNMMMLGEFRPINNREKKLVNLAKLLDAIKGDSAGSGVKETDKFIVRHINKIGKINNKAMAEGSHIGDRIAEKIRRDFPPEEWTPQIEGALPYRTMQEVYPINNDRVGKEIADNNRITRRAIDNRIADIVDDDFASIGYPKELISEANEISVADRGEPRFGPWDWQKLNDLVIGRKPEQVYHKTTQEKLGSIAQKGLVPAERLPTEEVNWPHFPEQQNKVFFGDNPDTGVAVNLPGSKATLRTKYSHDMNPDIHAPSGWKWYQTDKPVPPEALEIEAAPGQWEPLLDYIKKRSGK